MPPKDESELTISFLSSDPADASSSARLGPDYSSRRSENSTNVTTMKPACQKQTGRRQAGRFFLCFCLFSSLSLSPPRLPLYLSFYVRNSPGKTSYPASFQPPKEHRLRSTLKTLQQCRGLQPVSGSFRRRRSSVSCPSASRQCLDQSDRNICVSTVSIPPLE